MHKAHCLAAILVLAWILAPTALAETECIPATPGSCKILIIIHIAFSYNDSEISQNQIDAWVQDIKDTWNGEDGQTYGDCGCAVEFQVDAIQVLDPAQKNCNPGPPGYHCIMITDDAKNPPKNTAGTKTYRGYMYGVSNGSSTTGWWSDAMNAPPSAGSTTPASDAAHEAGHMLGLPDDYDKGPPERSGDNIMGKTTGPNAKPTQDQINTVVENNCGEDACPDECCCGNGEVDKSEACDPMALPTGCGSGAYCCPYCCQCHYGGCVPGDGKYGSEEDCKENCKDGQCLYNYETKCWDCVKKEVVVTPEPAKSMAQFLSELITGIISLVSPAVEPGAPEPAPADVGEFVLWIGKPPQAGNATQPGTGNATIPMAQVCGDKACNGGETCSSCPKDCGACPPRCGDFRCDLGEKCTCADCACGGSQYCDPKGSSPDRKGCVNSRCGDRRCTGGETCGNCERDCGACPAVCGNRKCELGENCSTCSGDCGVCPKCGNDRCEKGEDCDSCDDDCECDDDESCNPENDIADYKGCVKPGCGDGACRPDDGDNCACGDCEDICPAGRYCHPEAPDADWLGCSIMDPNKCDLDGLCDETEYCYTCPADCKCGPEDCCLPVHPGIGCGVCV